MKVIFMGTPDFAAGILSAILSAGHDVLLAVTQPDRPKGRKGTPAPSAVKTFAISQGIEVFTPQRLRNPDSVSYLRRYAPELIVVAAYGQILPQEVLDLPSFCCMNIHASLLPKYRGASPVQWAVIDGEKESGVTAMRMDIGLDTGDIIAQTIVPLAADETGGSLMRRLQEAGEALCVRTMEDIAAGRAAYTPQDDSLATYTSLIKKEMGLIDWSDSAERIERLIRGLFPWPGTYTTIDCKLLKIQKAAVLPSPFAAKAAAPGTVLSADSREGLIVQTGEGALKLLQVQAEGKRQMDAASFLRGNRVPAGTVLGE